MSIFISCEQKSSWALEHLVSKLEDSLGIDIEMSSTLTDGIKSEVELTSLDEFAIPTEISGVAITNTNISIFEHFGGSPNKSK